MSKESSEKKPEKIVITDPSGSESVDVVVLEQTVIGGKSYILTAEDEDGEVCILRAEDTDGETALYSVVSDDDELFAVAQVFEELLDVDLEVTD